MKVKSLLLYIMISFLIVSCTGSFEDRSSLDSDDAVLAPTQVAGSYLVNLENRCDAEHKGNKNYETSCYLVAVQTNGQEFKVTSLSDNIKLSWNKAVVLSGDPKFSCRNENRLDDGQIHSRFGPNYLAQVCDVSTEFGSAELEFKLNITNTTNNQTKISTSTVLLP